MEIFIIIVLGIIILFSIIKSMFYENKVEGENIFLGLDIIAIIVTIILVIITSININLLIQKEEVIISKELVFPEIKVEQEKLDFKITKSDTTYIYTFKKE